MQLKLNILLMGLSISFGVVLLVFYLNARKNRNTFKCDVCGRRYLSDKHTYRIFENNMVCEECYDGLTASHKIERG